jgi:hypothetical protein
VSAGRLLFVFVDGVGLGADDPAVNPLATATLPVLDGLLGGSGWRFATGPLSAPGASLMPLDATLGMRGIPQSGTGHAALFTGEDAVALHGGHFGPWVPVALRPLVAERSILARARAAGCAVAFANAYPEELVALARSGAARLPAFLRAGPPVAALGAGLLTRHTAALAAGEAVASEIVNDGWRERLGRGDLPRITPAGAGANLARLAAAHQLTFFAHYSTDSAGHARELAGGQAAMERVDAFLGGVLAALPADVLTVVASDHGNLEDVTVGHTRNPALGVAVGEGHARFASGIRRLTDVAPAVLAWLGVV